MLFGRKLYSASVDVPCSSFRAFFQTTCLSLIHQANGRRKASWQAGRGTCARLAVLWSWDAGPRSLHGTGALDDLPTAVSTSLIFQRRQSVRGCSEFRANLEQKMLELYYKTLVACGVKGFPISQLLQECVICVASDCTSVLPAYQTLVKQSASTVAAVHSPQ